MIVLELTFPAGRYHATPWGRHVNEGAIEWPPSPWRIVRALMATWYLKAREIPEATVRSLLNALSVPPLVHLPGATASHTRHYMPFNEGKNEKSTKVFDTFIHVSDTTAVLFYWEADLSTDERSALGILAGRLGYLGRAESLAQIRAYEAALTSSQSALESNKLGYEVGVRINIDVLNAQSQLYDTRQKLAKARMDTLIALLRLKAASGSLGEDDVANINTLLD